VRIWDMNTFQLIRLLSHDRGAVFGATFSHDGKLLATSGENNELRLWDTNTWTSESLAGINNDWAVFSLSFSRMTDF